MIVLALFKFQCIGTKGQTFDKGRNTLTQAGINKETGRREQANGTWRVTQEEQIEAVRKIRDMELEKEKLRQQMTQLTADDHKKKEISKTGNLRSTYEPMQPTPLKSRRKTRRR